MKFHRLTRQYFLPFFQVLLFFNLVFSNVNNPIWKNHELNTKTKFNSNFSFNDYQQTNNDYQYSFSFNYQYMNTLIDYRYLYYDKKRFLTKFGYRGKINDNSRFVLSIFLENQKFSPLSEFSTYWNDGFLDLSGDLDKGYFIYEKNKSFLKFGRDYFN